jgi:hypothetical protein
MVNRVEKHKVRLILLKENLSVAHLHQGVLIERLLSGDGDGRLYSQWLAVALLQISEVHRNILSEFLLKVIFDLFQRRDHFRKQLFFAFWVLIQIDESVCCWHLDRSHAGSEESKNFVDD